LQNNQIRPNLNCFDMNSSADSGRRRKEEGEKKWMRKKPLFFVTHLVISKKVSLTV
ncbi:hypothetical protein FCV25MIE_16566, partial [Fagus crenata]